MNLLKNLLGGRVNEEPTPDAVQNHMKDWAIVKIVRKQTGDAAVMRIRTEKPPDIKCSDYSTAVVIKWPYESSSPMPEQVDNLKMVAFEEAIDELFGLNNLSEMVQVTTGMGLKEWIYYTNNQDHFMRRFNELLTGHEPCPLAIEFYDDPCWEVWQDSLVAIEARTSLEDDA